MGTVDGLAAAARAEQTLTNQPGMCLATVNGYFGTLTSTGAHAGQYPDAVDAWTNSTDQHPGDKNPPRGALVLWGALTHPRWPGDENFAAGDICMALGGQDVRATDYPTAGRIGTCTIDQRTTQIGRPYLGWVGDFLGYAVNLGTAAITTTSKESITMAEAVFAAPNGTVVHLMPGQRTDFVNPDDYNDYRTLIGGLHTGANGQPASDLFLPPELTSVTGITWDRFVKLCQHFGVPTGRPSNQDPWLQQKFVGFTPTAA